LLDRGVVAAQIGSMGFDEMNVSNTSARNPIPMVHSVLRHVNAFANKSHRRIF